MFSGGHVTVQRDRYPSVRPYLGPAFLATAAVVLLPVVAITLLFVLMNPDPPMIVTAAVAVLVLLGTIVAGTALWMSRPDSAFISFSDLMLPRWVQRRRAEKQLVEGARLLGLDPSGQPVDHVRVPPDEQLRVLKDLTAALETKDPYTHGHSQRVERHCYRTAAAMGLSASDLEDVRKAAALHDVGKIRVSDRILRKDGPLTPEERKMIEEHSVVGAWMVSSVGNADVIAAVRHHHEHWDGSGYPDGLAGSNIPLFARIIAVADAYDAINSSRPYRASCGRERAISVLKAEAGRQFDPKVVESFLAALPTRLPVAAGLLVAFAGPQRLMRELFAWFRRFGAGSFTPAMGAAGAAVVLGASVFTPSLPERVPDAAPAIAAPTETAVPADVQPSEPIVLGKRVAKGTSVERDLPTREVRRPAPAAETASVEKRDAAPKPTAAGTVERTTDPASPEPKTKPQPKPEPKSEPAPKHTPPSDPQPSKGEDCGDRPNHKAQGSPGRSKHCD